VVYLDRIYEQFNHQLFTKLSDKFTKKYLYKDESQWNLARRSLIGQICYLSIFFHFFKLLSNSFTYVSFENFKSEYAFLCFNYQSMSISKFQVSSFYPDGLFDIFSKKSLEFFRKSLKRISKNSKS
jgi:hypothetical protein